MNHQSRDKMLTKKVIVVILNYKVKEQALKAVESVKKSDYKNIQIIVVDNDSKDGLESEVKKMGVRFIQSGDNLGYTGGNNIGIRVALDGGADYVLVLNPDATVENDTIRLMVAGLEKSGAGIAGPKIYFEGGKIIWHAGGKLDMLNVIGSHIGVDQKDIGQFEETKEVDYVSGAAIMVKREVFERIGFFDDDYFLYYEDADFCFRSRQAGFKVMYMPKAEVIHANAQSTGLGSPLQDYYITRNRFLFAKKFLPFRTQFALFREGVRNLGNPVRRLALADFMIGTLGKGNL